VDRHRHRGLGVRSDGTLGALDPGLRIFEPPLPGQRACEYRECHAGGRLVGPAVPFGQPDRLPAVLRRPGERPADVKRRLVRQAGELQVRPPDPARQRDALLQVRLGLLEPGCPVLGDAEVDQRQRAQVLAQAATRRAWGLGRGLQQLPLLGHRREVPALAGQQQPDHPEQHVHLAAPASRRRHRSQFRERQVPPRLLQRSLGQLVGRGQRHELGVRSRGFGREPGQQLVYGGGLPAQVKAGPVVGEQPAG
jgi:hypothetical protein